MPATNIFQNQQALVSDPSRNYAVVTPNDLNDLPAVANSIYVGGAGDLVVLRLDGTSVKFSSVPQGMVLPIRISRVMSTGTTATLLVAL